MKIHSLATPADELAFDYIVLIIVSDFLYSAIYHLFNEGIKHGSLFQKTTPYYMDHHHPFSFSTEF